MAGGLEARIATGVAATVELKTRRCLLSVYISFTYYSCGQRIHGLATTVGIAAGSQVPQAFAIAVYSD